MKKDAELHAEEDKRRKEMVEAKNNADSMIHMTEKTLGELGDKVDAETKGNVEREIENTKKALESDDLDTIKAASEAWAYISSASLWEAWVRVMPPEQLVPQVLMLRARLLQAKMTMMMLLMPTLKK